MGLNSLFRRLTENRGSLRCNTDKPARDGEEDNKTGFASSPDILDSCSKRSKKNYSPSSIDYPSCPALASSPTVRGAPEIEGCSTSSSSSSLLTHQQTPEKHQWFSRRKSCSLFVKSRRSTNQCADQPTKKLSWLPASAPFLRAMTHNPNTSGSTPCTSRKSSVMSLPAPLLLKCIDCIQNPFELFRLRAINHGACSYVQRRLERVTDMDVRKVSIDALISTSTAGTSTITFQNKLFYAHPAGHRVLMRFAKEGTRVEILVDDSWTSRDVVRLCQILDVFRLHLRNITLDAQIFELVIASLSIIDLDRWYAFQCYMKAINDFQLHLTISPHPNNTMMSNNFYWPNTESLIIRSTEQDSAHLARVLDYGVRSRLVVDRRRLEALKIILTDVEKMSRGLIRNLYYFRCWAGSAGFDDRFSQQCCIGATAQSVHATAGDGVTDQRPTVLC